MLERDVWVFFNSFDRFEISSEAEDLTLRLFVICLVGFALDVVWLFLVEVEAELTETTDADDFSCLVAFACLVALPDVLPAVTLPAAFCFLFEFAGALVSCAANAFRFRDGGVGEDPDEEGFLVRDARWLSEKALQSKASLCANPSK